MPSAKPTALGEMVRVGPQEDFIVELVELLKLMSYGERTPHRISGACWVFGEKGHCSKATQLSLCLCVSGTLILAWNSSKVFLRKIAMQVWVGCYSRAHSHEQTGDGRASGRLQSGSLANALLGKWKTSKDGVSWWCGKETQHRDIDDISPAL